jgi:hypothetical protein
VSGVYSSRNATIIRSSLLSRALQLKMNQHELLKLGLSVGKYRLVNK